MMSPSIKAAARITISAAGSDAVVFFRLTEGNRVNGIDDFPCYIIQH
jgi:hypothetical protein